MFRTFLHSFYCVNSIAIRWRQKIPGLIRSAIFDEHTSLAYVVIYIEQQRLYSVLALDILTGNIKWKKDILNGGYGTPAILGDQIIVPTGFSNIVALSKEQGNELWAYQTEARIRSSINICRKKAYFSAGEEIFEINEKGIVQRTWCMPEAFFFGSVDHKENLIFTMGVIADQDGESTIKIFAFKEDGGILYTLPISHGTIASSDTSGICWDENFGYVGGDNVVVCFCNKTGKVIWRHAVDGYAARQVCSIDNTNVYYTTQRGKVGAIRKADGQKIWERSTKELYIVSPISVVGDKLLLLADGKLELMNSINGTTIQELAVGHSPYSMVSVLGKYALLGGGEPPHHGLLFLFDLLDCPQNEEYQCTLVKNHGSIEDKFIEIDIKISHGQQKITFAAADVSIFHTENIVLGKKIDEHTYTFKVTLSDTINSGSFVLPLYLLVGSNTFFRTLLIELKRKKSLPKKAKLNIPTFIQEDPLYSGAAIGSTIKEYYGSNPIAQKTFRNMVERSRKIAGYESFQTWRIVLRRIFTSKAETANELPELRENFCSEPKPKQ